MHSGRCASPVVPSRWLKHSDHTAETFRGLVTIEQSQDSGERIVTSIRVHLTEEAFMVSIPKVVGVMSCGCVLGLALYLNGSHTIRAKWCALNPVPISSSNMTGIK